jgi:AraC family transcriptional regulator
MQAWESIQTSLEYLEVNLKDTIDASDLAARVHLSPFYFQKLFHRLVGKPVMEYVKLRRLAHVADKLRLEGGKILDRAVEYGFYNHETLTRSFKEAYGMTPEAYRSHPVFLSHFIMPDLSLKYHVVDEGVPLIANGIVLEFKRFFLPSSLLFSGTSVQNPINDTPGIDMLGELWRRYRNEYGAHIPHRMDAGREIGISSSGSKEGCFTYFAGAEVTGHTDEWLKKSTETEQYENRILQAGEYVVCTFEAENFHLLTTDALNKAVSYLFGTWLPGHKLSAEAFLAEIYDHRSLEVSEGTEMDIMVKLINS